MERTCPLYSGLNWCPAAGTCGSPPLAALDWQRSTRRAPAGGDDATGGAATAAGMFAALHLSEAPVPAASARRAAPTADRNPIIHDTALAATEHGGPIGRGARSLCLVCLVCSLSPDGTRPSGHRARCRARSLRRGQRRRHRLAATALCDCDELAAPRQHAPRHHSQARSVPAAATSPCSSHILWLLWSRSCPCLKRKSRGKVSARARW